MKILESAPSRYDQGIRILTLGKLDKAYNRLMSYIKKEQMVLDLGCGTGALTLRAAQKGAIVKAIDVNPQMLEIAEKQAAKAHLTENIEFYEMGVVEIRNEESENYDVVMSGLFDLDKEKCKGAALYEQVCPRNCNKVDREKHFASIPRANRCVQCGACIVQCPFDALYFVSTESDDKITPKTIRKFKLNLLGKRLVKV